MAPQSDLQSFHERQGIERAEERKFRLEMLTWIKQHDTNLDGELLRSLDQLIQSYQEPKSPLISSASRIPIIHDSHQPIHEPTPSLPSITTCFASIGNSSEQEGAATQENEAEGGFKAGTTESHTSEDKHIHEDISSYSRTCSDFRRGGAVRSRSWNPNLVVGSRCGHESKESDGLVSAMHVLQVNQAPHIDSKSVPCQVCRKPDHEASQCDCCVVSDSAPPRRDSRGSNCAHVPIHQGSGHGRLLHGG